MQGQIEAIVDGVFPATPENLAPLHAQALQLARLTDDLSTLADADAGHLSLDRRPVPMEPIADEIVGAVVASAAAKGVRVSADVVHSMAPLDADPVRLRQVLGNLIANAVRHTRSGGTVTLHARPEDGWAIIQVTDTGDGIGPEHLPHIFERFYRADESRTRATGGSGLGLAIARRLTEAHGGTISAASTVGEGTTFTLGWPLADEGPPPPPE
jgi:two-component system sensor histidine kinase BaeS